MSKLTDHQKIEIVEKYQTGNTSLQKLAIEYGVTKPSIHSLLNRRGISTKFKSKKK